MCPHSRERHAGTRCERLACSRWRGGPRTVRRIVGGALVPPEHKTPGGGAVKFSDAYRPRRGFGNRAEVDIRRAA